MRLQGVREYETFLAPAADSDGIDLRMYEPGACGKYHKAARHRLGKCTAMVGSRVRGQSYESQGNDFQYPLAGVR